MQLIPTSEVDLKNLEYLGKKINMHLKSFFDTYLNTKKNDLRSSNYNEIKLSYSDSQSEFQNLFPTPFDILKSLIEFLEILESFSIKVNKIKEKIDKVFYQEFNINYNQLIQLIDTFEKSISNENNWIKWATIFKNSKNNNTSLNIAPFDVALFLYENLFSKFSGGVVCSATLTVEFNFDYIRQQIGLDYLKSEKEIIESIYQSPFHYEDQVKLFVWDSDVNINSNTFIQRIGNQINMISDKIQRRILVLCTSYKQTTALRDYLKPKFQNDDRMLFTQTIGGNRDSLLSGYLKHKRSVLIGTSAFWEGVDLPGDKVELLVLLKVPFSNPSDPMIKAQIDNYDAIGKNPFIEFQVPDATVKLKQGFGRLIRNLDDSGICILADPRIVRTKYGSIILDSLPVPYELYQHASKIIYSAESFFGN